MPIELSTTNGRSSPSQHILSTHRFGNGHHKSALSIDGTGTARVFKRNAEIFGEREPANCFYRVIGGMVRTYKVLLDGRRQVLAFYLPGEVFGLETGVRHEFSADAVNRATVLIMERKNLLSLAERDREVQGQVWMFAVRELQ